jgi:cold shock CspA family protein
MPRGVLKNWFPGKSFGFIKRPGEKDVFAHICQFEGHDTMREEPRVGAEVEYEPGEHNGKPCATKIRILEW